MARTEGSDTERPHLLDERVAAATALTETERTVARYFVDHPEEVAFLSAAEIAETLRVSDATVIRTAQSLGYPGLSALKEELRDAVRFLMTPASRYRRGLDQLGAEPGGLLDHLIGAQISLLEEARTTFRERDLAAALQILHRAQRLVVFGLGPNAALADYFARSARRIGYRTLTLTERGAGLAELLMEIGGDDALLMIAYERVTDEVRIVADRASDAGAPCVLVTDTLSLALEGRHRVALTARRDVTETMPTVAVPLLVLEALLFGLADMDRERTLGALERLHASRVELEVD
jgi:DNA-binding MurR/RpiR family transcriptional regulator